MPWLDAPRIAVLIPCYNEEAAITSVVEGFRRELPGAAIYVYDNNSTDRTASLAAAAGAVVRREPRQGKGHVMRRMMSDIDADIFITADGDGTYDAASAPAMIRLLQEQRLAMVVGRRVHTDAAAYRRGHVLGNRLFTASVELLFQRRLADILSGYRVFSRAFVQSFPTVSHGFEVETELTVHALTLNLPIDEVETPYRARPDGSVSKLRTYRDGVRIALAILRLLRLERPQFFYTVIGTAMMVASVVLIVPVVLEFIRTGLVPRFPTAILSTGLAISALLSFACGLILDTVTQGRREAKLLVYLSTARQADRAAATSRPQPNAIDAP